MLANVELVHPLNPLIQYATLESFRRNGNPARSEPSAWLQSSNLAHNSSLYVFARLG